MKFGIVADDLTGALDTGLEFWKKGLRTVVVTSPVCVAKYAKRFDAISVDTSSRLSSPRKARGKVEEAARLLRRHGAKFFYKKVDSTLRGNVGAEIEAAMDELRIRTTVLAPSLPEQGRTVVGGELLVGGKPVVETEFGRDPLNPVSESDVKALVEGQTSMKVGSVRLPSVRGNLTRELESLKEGGANIIVADAETRKDLWRIAKSIAEAGLATLSCGSSGLASELPPAFGLRERPPPTIVLSGSLNPVTREQIKKVKEVFDPCFVELDRALSSWRCDRRLAKKLGSALEAVGGGQDAVLCLRGGKDFGRLEKEKALRSLGRMVGKALLEERWGSVLVVGGETASQACRALGSKAMEIEAEADLGLACAKMLDGKRRGTRVVTKAGGFGDAMALVKAINFLKTEAGRR